MPTTAMQVMDKLFSFWVPKAVAIVAEYGIADLLQEGPRAAAQIAREVGVHEDSLYRMMRGLTTHGFFVEVEPGVFSNTPQTDILRTNHPNSIRWVAMHAGQETNYAVVAHLHDAIKTGEPQFERVYGTSHFELLEQRPDLGEAFNQSMVTLTKMITPPLLSAFDFSRYRCLVDVGGGYGIMLAEILDKHPHLKGVLFDMPHVVSGAPKYLADHGVADRCEVVGGNFFEGVPSGGDAYLLKHIVHGFPEEQALQILKQCRNVMEVGAKVILIERVTDENQPRPDALYLDMLMLAMSGGRERTVKEYAELLEKAGFRLKRVVPTASPASVIEATAI